MKRKYKGIGIGILILIVLFGGVHFIYTVFQPFQENISPIKFSGRPNSILVADINRDGQNEILVSSEYPINLFETHLYSIKNSKPVKLDAVEHSGKIFFNDVDNDGVNEIIVGDSIFSYENNKLKNETVMQHRLMTAEGDKIISVGDVDNDGIIDVITGNTVYNMTSELVHKNVFIGDIGDADNDGKNELVTIGGGKIYVFKNGKVYWKSENLMRRVSSVQIKDINNDKKNEILVSTWCRYYSNNDSSKLYYFYYDSGVFNKNTLIEIMGCGTAKRDIMSFAVGDLDRDNINEIVIGDRSKFYVYKLDEYEGTFNKIAQRALESWAYTIDIYDVNNDGKNEILVGSSIEPYEGCLDCGASGIVHILNLR